MKAGNEWWLFNVTVVARQKKRQQIAKKCRMNPKSHLDGFRKWSWQPFRYCHVLRSIRYSLNEDKNEPKLKVGDYVEDCRYHPCVITEINYEYDDLLVKSLLPNHDYEACCSIRHCGIRKLSQSEAHKMRAIYNKDGVDGLIKHGGEWRPRIESMRKKSGV